MLLFVFAALLTLVVVVIVVRPLLRELDAPASAERYNAAVYRDQLEELRREEARRDQAFAGGELPSAAEDIASARLEIERRLLAADRRAPALSTRKQAAPAMSAVVLAGALASAAGAIYLALGDPAAPDRPLRRKPAPIADAQASPESAAVGASGMHAQMDQMVASLTRKMQTRPNDPDGWGLLARSLMRLDRPAAAVDAYQHAIAVTHGRNAQLDAEYAEARVIAADGAVDAEALSLFQRLLSADARNPQARYYLALAKVQNGDVAGGLADWRSLEAASPADAPWLETLRRRIAEAQAMAPGQATTSMGDGGPGPDSAAVAAAASLSDADRDKIIEGMVDGLAARLKRSPDDLNGWRELARADAVLGRRSQAAAAARQVQRLEQANP